MRMKKRGIKAKPAKRKKPIISIAESQKSSTITTHSRVINVCKVYNISTDTLIKYLRGLGYENISITTSLNDEILSQIDKEFQQHKNIKDKIRGKTEVNFITPIENSTSPVLKPKVITEEPIYKHQVLHLENNLFTDPKQEIIYKKFPKIESYFTDNEAINLCNKMTSSFTRDLCGKLNNPKYDKALLIYQIHSIANKALWYFGGKILTFIIGLRKLQFRNQTAFEIKHYKNVIPDFPMISFVSDNASFKISFFLKRNKQTNNYRPDIRLYSSKNYEQIGAIDEEGYVISRIEKYRPQINLFYEATRQDNSIKIYSGVETGNCDLCGRQLSHPTSLRIGIGPICAKNIHIDTSIYNYS